jgi:hypothetical protein
MNKQETIIQSLNRIEKVIYSLPFNELTDYLRGVRDMINLINGEESSCCVASYIIERIEETKLEYELPF